MALRPRFDALPRDLGTVRVHRNHDIRSGMDRLGQAPQHGMTQLEEISGTLASPKVPSRIIKHF
jgi:hypothetical protein